MENNTMELQSAMETMQYKSIKPNLAYKNQRSVFLPRGDMQMTVGGAVFLLTPNKDASMSIINGNYALFYRSGYRIYSTATKYNERIGARRIHENRRSEIRKEFLDNRANTSIRFIAIEDLSKLVVNTHNSFIYDVGSWNQTYFHNRYVRNTKFMCQNYMEFLSKRFDDVPITDYKNKVLYIPANQWFHAGSKLGIRKKDLDNPLSIIMLALYRFPDTLRGIVNGGYDILIVDEPAQVFIKLKITSTNLKDTKKIYQTLKAQLRKMKCFEVEEEDEIAIEEEAANTEDKHALFSHMSKKLTGDATLSDTMEHDYSMNTKSPEVVASSDDTMKPSRSDRIQSVVKRAEKSKDDNIFNIEDDSSFDDDASNDENPDSIDDEVDNTIAAALNDDEDLTNGTYSEDDAANIIEDTVKREVFISKFIPERSKAATEKIESYARRQDDVIRQTIPEMKSKLIDTTSFEEVLDVHNENIKESRFANFDKSYIEKKFKPDLINSVAKLSKTDFPFFIESIDIVDTSDVMNQKDTYTYNLVDEQGRKFKIVLDIPKIIDNNYVFMGGNKRLLLKQRLNRPVVKIRPDEVQIATWYNKCMIKRYGRSMDAKTTALFKYITKSKKVKVVYGKAKIRNKSYRTSVDFDFYARSLVEATIGNTRFIFDLPKLEEELKSLKIKESIVMGDELACGIKTNNDGTHEVIRCAIDGKTDPGAKGINDLLEAALPAGAKNDLAKLTKPSSKFAYARMTVLAQKIPVIYFMLFCEGFTKVMTDCGIHYEVVDNTKENRKTDWGEGKDFFETQDKIIVYDKYPYENSLLMNGIKGLPLQEYTFAELDSKETYIDLVTIYYSSTNMAYSLDQFKDFMIDDASKEMLKDFNQPTELVPLLFYAVQLLVNNQFVNDTDMTSVRIRSTEVIPNIAYDVIAQAYGAYRTTHSRNGKGSLNVPRNAVMKALATSTILDDASVSNPVMTVEKIHTCTIKASSDSRGVNLGGQNKSNGMTHARRSYDPTMVGIFGITSTPDAEVGIKRFLTMEPNITSTRGYIESSVDQDVEKLNSANLFTFSEALNYPSVRHDDPPRTGMAYSQTSHMVLVNDASPVLIGNHSESVLPYHMSGEFCFVAKKPGTIIENKRGIYVVKYDDGTFDSFDTNPIIHKNSAEGMYTELEFTCDHEVGYKFKKNEVLAMDKRAFSRDANGMTASMNMGVLAKVAIVSSYDIYEDSQPLTKKISERLATSVIHMHPVTFSAGTVIESMVKVGDNVNTGDTIIKFDANSGDPDIEDFLSALKDREEFRDKLVDSSMTTIKSKESGTIIDIRVYTTVPTESLSPSLQKIVKEYHGRIFTKSNILEKYKNPGDNAFYKCGQLLTETTDVTEASFGKVKGQQVGEGVYIEIYTKSNDIMKKGDKQTNYCALKGVTSHIIPEGQEPFSEFRPDEEVSALVAPLSILARKTPSIYINLFGNKVLIELKRKLKADYLGN